MKKAIDLEKDEIKTLFKSYFYPGLISLVIMSLYIVVDGFFVGLAVGKEGLAAANIAVPFFPFAVGVGLFFGLGGSTVAAGLLAQKNAQKAREVFSSISYINFTLSLVLTAILFFYSKEIAYFLGANNEIIKNADIYLKTTSLSTVFFTSSVAFGFFIRLDGAPKLVMISSVVGSLVNVVLDFVLMIVLDLGMFGASFSTVVANIVSFIICIYYILYKNNALYFVKFTLDLALLKRAFLIGFSGLLVELCLGGSILIHNKIIENTLGTIGLSAYAVINYIYPLLMPIFLSLSQALMPIVSYNYSINKERVKDTLAYALKLSFVFGVVGFLVVFLGAKLLVHIFLQTSTPSFNLALTALRFYSLSLLLMGANMVFISYLQSAQRHNLASFITVFKNFIFVLLFLIFLPKIIGTNGIWLSVFAAEGLIFAIIAVLYTLKKIKI